MVAGGGGWWWTRRRAAAPDVAAKHTQVTFSGDVIATALSSDGRSIADLVGTQGEKVRVLVRDLGAGQPLQVWEGVEATCLTWTPDGLQVLIAGPREGDKGQAIHIVPRLGGAARRLPVTELVASMAVSPDGRRLATVNGGFAGATVVSLESGKQDRIPVPGAQYTWGVDWSPVTNRLVVVSLDKENHPSVSVVGADGSGLRRVYGGKEQIRAVSWSRAEDVLYLMRRRGRATELLRLSTAGGDSSAPQLLMGGLPPGGSFQISADGQRLLHTRLTGEANLFRVDLEARGGAPIAITKGTWELGEPHVSPDGRWISATRGGEEIVRFPIEGGEPVVLTNGADGVWSPDGKRLAFASDRGGTLRPYVADADGQRANEIPGADDLASPQLRWFSDRQLAWHRPDNHDFRIRDLEIGREESLVKDPSAGFVFGPCLSPKGDQVAVLWNRVPGFKEGLWLISWPGREERLVAPDLYPFGWSADGKWIYATSEIAPELVRVSPATGAIEVIVRFDAAHADLGGCDLTPDRRSVICSAGLGKMDAWLIEHFDPHVPPSGR